jgi:hypothetical protein
VSALPSFDLLEKLRKSHQSLEKSLLQILDRRWSHRLEQQIFFYWQNSETYFNFFL